MVSCKVVTKKGCNDKLNRSCSTPIGITFGWHRKKKAMYVLLKVVIIKIEQALRRVGKCSMWARLFHFLVEVYLKFQSSHLRWVHTIMLARFF